MTNSDLYSRFALPAKVVDAARDAETALTTRLDERRLSHEQDAALLSLRRSVVATFRAMESNPAPDSWMVDFVVARFASEVERIVGDLDTVAYAAARRTRDYWLAASGAAQKYGRLVSNETTTNPV
jgi:hypothetical protein